MGMINKLLDVLNLSNNDYDDDYDDGYGNDEDDYEETKSTRKRLFSGKSEPDDDNEIDDKALKQNKLVTRQKSKVIQMKNNRGLEVCVIRPTSIEDAREITDTLLSGKAVVLNLEGIHVEVAQRIIDFSAGSSYSIGGNLQKITNYIFIITPPNVDVSGDFQELVAGGIDLTTFNEKF
ncbi:cell division protein SepF [[Clostridium] fimetarium]|uniref:Cell division protein SepF n=1 Tax=[Clostridium] fimetarium TaxID=99656 RepID=A0A1I0QIN8_9FIRM|nr:cell division protein SepF [[Clostridium] fimetarium]SEW26959.1 cell division inhibitor SepF [[Clostridium] fimetarium]